MAALESSPSRHHPSSILACSIGRKRVPSAWRHLKHRFLDINKVEFWGCLEAEKTSKTWNNAFSTSRKSHFRLFITQEMSSHCLETTRKEAFLILPSRIFGWKRVRRKCKEPYDPLNIDFSTLTNSHFAMGKRMIMSSKCHGNLWNIAFSKSPKSNFGLVKMKKMSSQCLASIWNIAFSTSSKTKFGHIKRQNMTL